ncbi:MAG: ribulose bisphosphate carboxylase small subunit [Elainellaceae cyanobacterium]
MYYLSPRFRDKLAIHITKNYLDLPGVRVPLILGVHGRKGEGKTFQCELTLERMGVEVVHISGGELESPDAGDPARLLRLRYREAAELVRVRGRMAVVMINDLDAGAGRFDAGTQYTVNTQLVNATLMNIADNPTNVQLPGSYDENPIRRVPILVTGNDFSTLYAPLVRDGRMEKFYWQPDEGDRLGIVGGIFAPDGLSAAAVEHLVAAFPNQAIDFFSALRARVYDEQVRRFIEDIGIERVSQRVVNSTEGPPRFPPPPMALAQLLSLGERLVDEQRRVQDGQLAEAYNRVLQRDGSAQSSEMHHTPQPNRSQLNHHQPNGQASMSGAASESTPEAIAPASACAIPLDQQPLPHLSESAHQTICQLISQGYHIGIEHVDRRRFQTNAWQSFTAAREDEQGAMAALKACLALHPNDYVRLIGVDPGAKRRVMEAIVQRPTATLGNAPSPRDRP